MVAKKIAVVLSLFISVSVIGGCSSKAVSASKKDNQVIQLGITQIMEHPALDSSRKGFIDALKSKGFEDGKNIKIDYQNAQNDMPTTQTIASKFVSDKKDLILAISTPSAQAAYNATKNIPILITAVTDPVAAGLAKSLESSGTNVTGTSDDVPIDKQFDLIKKILPDAKKIGILYNTSEANSEVQVKKAQRAAPDYGFEIITSGITSVNDIPQALASILGKIDVLYVPTDNMVVASMPIVTDQCFKKNIPVIGSESSQVENGALATTGIDYYKLGYQTGLMAVDVLNGKKPKELPISLLTVMKPVINTDAAKKLNVTIPADISKASHKVTGGVK